MGPQGGPRVYVHQRTAATLRAPSPPPCCQCSRQQGPQASGGVRVTSRSKDFRGKENNCWGEAAGPSTVQRESAANRNLSSILGGNESLSGFAPKSSQDSIIVGQQHCLEAQSAAVVCSRAAAGLLLQHQNIARRGTQTHSHTPRNALIHSNTRKNSF